MKKSCSAVLMIALFFSVSMAQEKPAAVIAEWLKGLQKKIEQIIPRKTISPTTSVAGVRGSKEQEQVKLYWKGKKGKEGVSEEELEAFQAALRAVSEADRDTAVRELEKFMADYPDSAFIPDAKKTLDLAKAAPPEERPEQKADTSAD